MSPKTLQAIFLRKGGAGSYTKIGNLIPSGLLPEDISESDILVSYFRDPDEWLAVANSEVMFKNAYTDGAITRIKNSEIEMVRPFPFKVDLNINQELSNQLLFVKKKNGESFNIKVETGPPRNGLYQMLYNLAGQKDN